MDEQLAILMRGTRFADETDEWSEDGTNSRNLRTQMQEELYEKLRR